MKIACIIPDRNDRPLFLEHCRKMLANQTVQVDLIWVVNAPATSEKPDITKRYRLGYELISDDGQFDVIFLIENDDYYAPDYIEKMLTAWKEAGKPELFGTAYTYYYHVGLGSYFLMKHPERASAMNTMIVPGLKITWPNDNEVYTDLHLWLHQHVVDCRKKTWSPSNIISIGIKHGVGLCGGRHHFDRLGRYKMKGGLGNEDANGIDDINMEFLRANVDKDSFEFYLKMNKEWQITHQGKQHV